MDISYGSRTCSGTMNNQEKTIKSPNYPSPYGNNDNCHWKIQTSAGGRIELRFEEFETETRHDSLSVYNGRSNSNSQHIRSPLSGSLNPNNIVSTGNEMYLVWDSDATTRRKGFKIEITAFGKLIFTSSKSKK